MPRAPHPRSRATGAGGAAIVVGIALVGGCWGTAVQPGATGHGTTNALVVSGSASAMSSSLVASASVSARPTSFAFQAAEGEASWTTLRPRVNIGRVVAATYHAFDSRLWVLDEVGGAGGRAFRLLRVAPFDGSVEEMGRFPRTGVFDSHWLVSDHDGRILVGASNTHPARHVLVRLHVTTTDAGQRLEMDDSYAGQGELVAAPRVSNAGLGLIVRQTRGDVPKLVSHLAFPSDKGKGTHLKQLF